MCPSATGAHRLHRCDLTKDQRDQHIRRYAELLEAQREVSRQIDAKPVSGPQGGRPKGIAGQIAEETGLSKRTVERVLNPPAPRPTPDVKIALEPESEHDAIIREANAIVLAIMACGLAATDEGPQVYRESDWFGFRTCRR